MSKKTMGIGVVVLVIILIVGLFGGTYNKMLKKNEEVENAWSQIDVQLQRRADLIPNLVNTVKGYNLHESEILTQISDSRAKLAGAGSVSEKAQADSELNGALSRLLVVVENYPDLKASSNFQNLMDELSGTENRISVARKDYNDSVKSYNLVIKKFPNNMIAGMFGFESKDYFEASENSKEVPNVDFNS